MFCPSCGKNVPDGSSFCLHCGASMTALAVTSDKQIEWEYCDYLLEWEPGEGGKYYLSGGEDENTIRLAIWNKQQLYRLSDIQNWLDTGWQPVTEVGPGAYSFRRLRDGGLIKDPPYLTITEFRVKMRRPKPSSK